eukprot:g4265.t1
MVRESRVRVILELPKPPETVSTPLHADFKILTFLQIVEHPDEEPRAEVPQVEEVPDVNKLMKEKTELLHQVTKLERQLKSPQNVIGGFTVFHLLMVAILAFLIGHYLQI